MRVTQPHLFPSVSAAQPTDEQRQWLKCGLDQAGGKLPLHTITGERIASSLITACVQAGWAEPWAINPLRANWQVCRLTEAGRTALQNKEAEAVIRVDFTQWKRDSSDVAKTDYSQAIASGLLRPDAVNR